MYSFQVSGQVEFVNVENFDKRPFEKLSMNYTFDLEVIEKIIQKKIEEEKIKGSIKKLLFSLQKLEGKDYLVGTVFLSNMGLIKVSIEIPENKITSFEKKSFFDMLKVVKGNKKE
jgi:phenylalanyl-tRNA synthetase beta subunit